MADSDDYMAYKHETLKNDYITDGIYSDSCSVIADELADILKEEGKDPYILIVKNDEGSLIPLAFGGRVRWGVHVVCCADGMIYDPILDHPTPIKDYCKAVFGKTLSMHRRMLNSL